MCGDENIERTVQIPGLVGAEVGLARRDNVLVLHIEARAPEDTESRVFEFALTGEHAEKLAEALLESVRHLD